MFPIAKSINVIIIQIYVIVLPKLFKDKNLSHLGIVIYGLRRINIIEVSSANDILIKIQNSICVHSNLLNNEHVKNKENTDTNILMRKSLVAIPMTYIIKIPKYNISLPNRLKHSKK